MMVKRILLIISLAVVSVSQGSAEKFYWVNNGGNWSDYSNHWATTSGGSVMHNNVPGINDTVYFDSNSFTQNNQLISLDTSMIDIAGMDWSGVNNNPDFYSQSNDTLFIRNFMILSSNMGYNHFGPIYFEETGGANINFDTKSNKLKGDIYIDIPGGSLSLPSGINSPDKNIYLLDGTLDAANNNITFFEFNSQNGNPVNITGSPVFTNTDTINSKKSVFFHPNLDVSGLSGVLNINMQTADSNFVSFANHKPQIDINISGAQKLFLQGNLKTQGDISAVFAGELYTGSYDIECNKFSSMTSLQRTIDFGNSAIKINEFEVNDNSLNLNANNASLIYTGSNEYIFNSNNKTFQFKKLSVNNNGSLFVESDISIDSLKLSAGSNYILKQGVTTSFSEIDASGNCGQFIKIRSYCPTDKYSWPTDSCIEEMAVMQSLNNSNFDYIKTGFVKAQGGSFNANNSYAQGKTTGWTINQAFPSDTLYWIGNTGIWNNPNNWSSVSGGTPQSCIPNPESVVIFDDNSFSTNDSVYIYRESYCKKMLWDSLQNQVVWSGDKNLNIKGGIKLNKKLKADYSGDLILNSTQPSDTFNIETQNIPLNSKIIINGSSARLLKDSLITTGKILYNKGTLITKNQYVRASALLSDTNTTRNLNIENSEIVLDGSNEAWLLNSNNLNFISDSSTIILNSATHDIQNFYGGGLNYFSLNLITENTNIAGSNSFEYLSAQPGNSIAFEESSITSVDSVTASGTCDNRINLRTKNANKTAQIVKTGYNSLLVENVILSNIKADTSGGIYYEASASLSAGDVSGWTFTSGTGADVYYWTGSTKQWSDPNNWMVNSLPATCLPGINDTVVFDDSHLTPLSSDSVIIDRLSSCTFMDASGLINNDLNFIFDNSLISENGVKLSKNVSFNYASPVEISGIFDKTKGLKITPDSTNATIDADSADININIFLNPYNQNDSVLLTSDLEIEELTGLNVLSGNLISGENKIKTDIFNITSDANKSVNIENSEIEIGFYYSAQDSSKLNLLADSSEISLIENIYNNSVFEGGDQNYHNMNIYLGANGNSVDSSLCTMSGSNNFHNFSVYPGGTVTFNEGSVQTVDSLLTIDGTCTDRIKFNSSIPGNTFTFVKNNTYPDTAYNLIASDMTINSNSSVAMLSTDNGNNTGWNFNSMQASTALFSKPDTACIESNIHFTNNSSSMWGGMTNLEFEWEIVNFGTFTTTDLDYTFSSQGSYIITLTATDTVTKCYDTYTDTLNLVKHTANLAANPQSLSICENDLMKFTASSNNNVKYQYYLNNNPLNLGDTVSIFETDTLSDGDEIFIRTDFSGCYKYSDTLTVTVDPLPQPYVSVIPADTSICAGDSITFIATGADTYQFYIDSASVTSMTSDSVYSTSSINDMANIQVKSLNTSTGCSNWSTDEFTVRVWDNPVINLTSTTTPTICQGEELEFAASGTDNYEYFINGISQGLPTSDSTLTTNTLTDGDLVTVEGINQKGCSTLSSSVEVTVNTMPQTNLVCDDADSTICMGDSITFTGSGAQEYLFYIDTAAQGNYSIQDQLVKSDMKHQQTVKVVGKTGNCYDTSSNIKLNVFPDINLTASKDTICTGDSVTFTASGDSIYQFLIDGNPVTNASSDSIFTAYNLTDGQEITVAGTPNACTPTPVNMIVNPLPAATFTCSDADTNICQGEQVSFTASGALKYRFFVNGISQGPASTGTTFATSSLSDMDTISMLAYSAAGCMAYSTDTFIMEVRPLPNVSLSGPGYSEICNGDMVNVNASGADTYEFFINGNPTGAPSASGSFSTDSLNNGDQITVEGTTNNCSDMAPQTLDFTVYSIPQVNLQALTPTDVCQGDTIKVSASGAAEYEFLINGNSQGAADTINIYSSSSLNDQDIISVAGYKYICSDTADNQIQVDINQIPDVNFITNMSAGGICLNDTVTFSASGAQNYEYFIDGNSLGNPSPQTNIEFSELLEGQTLSVKGYNGACKRMADTSYTINLNRVNISLSTNLPGTEFCDQQQITATAQGADIYEFFVNGSSVTPADSNNVYTFTPAGGTNIISVEGTDLNNSCKEMSSETYLTANPVPEIFVNDSTSFCENDSVLLSTGLTGNIQWIHNGDLISGANGVDYFANQPGDYSVSMIKGGDASVYSTGNNDYGQLGDGTTTQSQTPVNADIQSMITDISAGKEFVVALDNNGQAYTWGKNNYGQLGDGSYSPSYSPSAVSLSEDAVSVIAGYEHTIVIMEDSTIMSWGRNDNGQLGYGNNASSNFPNAIQGINNIIDVAAGESHTIALTSDGKVYSWGNNSLGQLGTGNLNSENSPVLISALQDIEKIACGANHNLAIDNNKKLWVWGSNSGGQLGTSDNNNRLTPVKLVAYPGITKIAAGKNHSIFYNENGDCFAAGSNQFGQLGKQGISSASTPVKINLSGIIKLEAGYSSSFAVRNDKSLWAWGQNASYQLMIDTSGIIEEPKMSENVSNIADITTGKNFSSLIWDESIICSSDITNLQMLDIPNFSIIRDDMKLYVEEGNSWQWLLNGSAIPGETDSILNVSAEGDYTVLVGFSNGCSFESDTFEFSLSAKDWLSERFVTVSPNPSTGRFTLELSMPSGIMSKFREIEIISPEGRKIFNKKNGIDAPVQKLNLQGIAPGMYYLKLNHEIKPVVIKLIISR